MTSTVFPKFCHSSFRMDFWSDTKAENKIIRRNALRNILASAEKASPLSGISPTLFYSQLLFEDEYDASRELSYKIVMVWMNGFTVGFYDISIYGG